MAGIEGLLAGHTLGERYRIEAVIGRGGMGAVYRGFDERLRRPVAVKVVAVPAPDEEARERARQRFHREARSAASLQHPNVVAVYDFGTDPDLGLDYLVMEYLPGEDLARRLARTGRQPLEVSLRVLREAAEGVGAGHRAGLIHRDVKPGNLFLADEPGGGFRVRVLDFGIARAVTGEGALTPLTRGSAPLSPAYAAPEQLAGAAEITPAADVYSLGVIAHELLSGRRLFGGEHAGRDRREVPPLGGPGSEVPPAVAAVVERALSLDPADRYATADHLARALEAARTAPVAEPVRAAEPAPASAPYRARGAPRLPERSATPVPAAGRRRPAALPTALAAAALLILGGWWALGRGGEGAAPDPPAADRATPRQEAAPPARAGTSPTAEPVEAVAGGVAPAPVEPQPGSEPAPSAPAGSGGAATASPPRGDAGALNREGLDLFARGSHAAAVARFRRAVALAPDNAYYRNNLGWALHRDGHPDEALRELERVVRLDPRRDIAHANLGEVHLARGDTAAAIASYRRFLELNDDPRREAIARAKLERIGGE